MRGAIEMSHVDDRVRGVDAWLEWRTTGPEPASGRTEVTRISLEGRTLGGRARPTFSLKLPREPLSYAGTLFSIEWFLVVSADVAWAKDPRVEKSLEVGPSEHSLPGKPREELLDGVNLTGAKLDVSSIAIGLAGSGIAATVVGASLGLVGGLAIVAAGGGAFLATRAMRKHQRAQLFGTPSVVLDPGTLELGEPFTLRVVTTPRISVLYTDASWKLAATEVLTTGSGKSRRVERHTVYAASGAIGQITRTASPRDGFAQTTVSLPDATFASFATDRHELEWKLFVTLEAHPEHAQPLSVTHELEVDVRR